MAMLLKEGGNFDCHTTENVAVLFCSRSGLVLVIHRVSRLRLQRKRAIATFRKVKRNFVEKKWPFTKSNLQRAVLLVSLM